MTSKSCIRSAMDYVDGLTLQFSGYLTDLVTQAKTGMMELSVEDSTLLAGAMISTIAVLLDHKLPLHHLQKMLNLYREVDRPVAGADSYYRGHVNVDPNLTPDKRAEATHAAELKHEVYRWYLELLSASGQLSRLPTEQQTNRNLRTAFLRCVAYKNSVSPPEEQLDFRTLNIDYSPI